MGFHWSESLEPVDTKWRIDVAQQAMEFFDIMSRDPDVLREVGRDVNARAYERLCEEEFFGYLKRRGLSPYDTRRLSLILHKLTQAGLLIPQGWDHRFGYGQTYVSHGVPLSAGDPRANLWLSEVLGDELIIPSFGAVTVQVRGLNQAGDEKGATGLVLDSRHVVTNRHVVEALVSDIQVTTSGMSPPATEWPSGSITFDIHRNDVHLHPQIDVALVALREKEGESGFTKLPGLSLRDPRWGDRTYLFGYPTNLPAAEMGVTVQQGDVVLPSLQIGEVVMPVAQSMPSRDKLFLFSAIARPGNSGGPIVAQDGRVIGLVVDHSDEAQFAGTGLDDATHARSNPPAAPFYRGIPSSEMIRALEELGFAELTYLDKYA